MEFDLKSRVLWKQVLGILMVTLGIVAISIYFPKTNSIAIGNGSPPITTGTADTYGIQDANGVFVSGSYAYIVTDNNSGADPEFYIINIASPGSPQIVGSYNVNVSVNKVYVAGDYAYLATKKDAEDVIVLNFTNKAQPTKVIGMNIPNNSEALAISGGGSNLYVGFANSSNNREFYFLSVSNPGAPQVVGSYEVGGAVSDIAANGNYVYLATSNNSKELTILNAATSNSMELIGSYDLSVNGGASAIAIAGEKVYLATANNASQPDFFILNAPLGSAISIQSSLDLGTSNTGVVVAGQVAYIVTQTSSRGVIKINVSNAALPVEVASFDAGGRVNDIVANATYLYVATADNEKEFQVVNPQEGIPRPNIILVMTDDQRWDTLQYMPHVTNLIVNEGISFTNGFVTTPLCCPARSSFLTGRYAHNHGVKDNVAPNGGATVFNDTSTIATWLHDAGYKTSFVGKYLNEYDLISSHIPPGWDDWHVITNPGSQQSYYDYGLNENGTIVYYGNDAENDYSTDILKAKAVDFIQNNTDKPFFLVYAPAAPHAPYYPAPRHQGMFSDLTGYRPLSWKEADVSDKPDLYIYEKSIWETSPLFDSLIDKARIDAIESLQAVDEAVRDIVTTIDQAGLKKDTIIIFTSDNGYLWGEHWGFTHKRCGYEECIRVPFVLRYPAIVTNSRQDNHFILNIDLAPTLAELAGVSIPSPVNGKSFLNILKNIENSWRTDFLTEGWRAPSSPNQNPQPQTFGSVRNGEWKFIQSEEQSEGPAEELYNLLADPYELHNIATSSPNIVNQMKARLLQLQAE